MLSQQKKSSSHKTLIIFKENNPKKGIRKSSLAQDLLYQKSNNFEIVSNSILISGNTIKEIPKNLSFYPPKKRKSHKKFSQNTLNENNNKKNDFFQKLELNNRWAHYYSLKNIDYQNYKYLKIDKAIRAWNTRKEEIYLNNLEKPKKQVIWMRGLPSLEKCIEELTTPPPDIVTEKIDYFRKSYNDWKEAKIQHKDYDEINKFEEKEFFKTKNKFKNNQFLYNDQKPKTADCVLGFENGYRIQRNISDKKEENQINLMKSCGFNKNYSSKYKHIFLEFKKIIGKQIKNASEHLLIQGKKEEILQKKDINKDKSKEKNEINKDKPKAKDIQENKETNKKKIENNLIDNNISKIEGIDEKSLTNHFEIFKKIDSKITERILFIFGINDKNNLMIFTQFLKFYKLFIERSCTNEEYNEFIYEFLIGIQVKQSEIKDLDFIKNLKLILKNIKDREKKYLTYQLLNDIFRKNELFQNKLVDLNKLTFLFQKNIINSMDLFDLIVNEF